MGENKYEISLGVQVETDDIKKQISSYESQLRPIKLEVDIDAKQLAKKIETGLKASMSGSKTALTLDTASVEKSLDDVSASIKEIRTSIGTLDSKTGMKSLLSSINQISLALEKASSQFESLNANLSALSGKDLSLNFGINMGGSNPIGRNAAYGSKVRGETLPQLKQQMNELVKYYNTTYKQSLNEFEALQKLVSGTKLSNGDFFEQFLFGKDSVASRMSGGSLASQMQAYKEYINMFKQAASLKGLDISSVTSGFSKSADQLIQDAQDIQTGAKEMEDGFEKLKQIFGGGNNLNVEGISAQLDSIVTDLGEIKSALIGLSSGVSLDGLTESFNRLSDTLEKLMTNAKLAQDVLGDGLDNLVSSDGASKQAQEAKKTADVVVHSEERKQQAFKETAVEAKKLDNVSTSGGLDAVKVKEMTSDADRLSAAFSKLKNIQGNINNVKIGKIDTSKGVQELQTLENQLESLSAEYNETVSEINGMGGLSKTQFQSLQNQINTTSLKLEQLKSKVSDARTSLAKNLEVKLETGKFSTQVYKVTSDVKKLGSASDEVEAEIKELNLALANMKIAADNGDIDRLIGSYRQFEIVLQAVENQLKENKIAEQNANNKDALTTAKQNALLRLKNLFGENSEAAKMFGSEVQRLQREINECGNLSGISNLNRQIANLGLKVKEADVQTQTFGQRLKKQFAQYSSYFSVASVFMYVTQGLRDMFEQVKAIDSAMTELKKVTNETDAAYNKFLSNTANRAKEIGTTIDGLVSSTADFARLGYGFEDAQGLAEVANIYAVVGDEIDGVEQATESLISTMAAFKGEINGMSDADFAMSIVDKFNEIGNNFAISSGGIGEALERSASSMMAANNSLDETIALITAANTVVQDPDAVGTAFKTISMRIRGAKTELEEAGLETEGMVESTAKLRSEIMALTGVDIMDGANQFKSTYAIMDELAKKWKDLSDIQQATVTELIAGKRQGNIVSSLMQNFDTARDALEVSLNSSGSAMQEHEKWQQSLEARINNLKAAWQSLSQSFLSSDFLKVTLDAVIDLVNGITWLIDKVGTLPTLIGAAAAGFSAFKNKGILTFDKETKSIQLFDIRLTELANKYELVQTKIAKYNSLSAKSQEKLRQEWSASNTSFGKYISGLNGSKASFSGYIGSLVGATIKTIALEAATIALNAALTMGISFAIQALITWLDKMIVTKKELAEEVEEVTSAFKEQSKELQKLKGSYDTSDENSMISRYEKLSKGVNRLGENVSLTADEYSEYQNIVNTIAEQIPSLVSGYDSQGNALLSCKGNVEELTAAYEKLIKVQNNEIITKTGDIEKDFENAVNYRTYDKRSVLDAFDKDLTFDDIDVLKKAMKDGKVSVDEIKNMTKHIGYFRIKDAIKTAGLDWSKNATYNIADIQNIIDEFYSEFENEVEGMKSLAQAKLSQAIDLSDSDYADMSDTMKNVARQMVNSFDGEFFKELQDKDISVTSYINDLLSKLNGMDETVGAQIETAFDLETQFNGGEIPYGEYVKSLEKVGEVINGLDLDKDTKKRLQLSLGLDEDGLVEEYHQLRNRLADSEFFNIMPSDYVPFIESLSTEEVSVLWKVIPRLEETEYKETIADVKASLEREMMLQGLSLDLNLEVESAGIDALNTALAESVTGSGLSSDSIAALKSRYAELENQGYDLASMFEETSNGIHLNREEFDKLEKAYASQKLDEVNGDLEEMQRAYDQLGEDIKNCTDPVEKSKLFSDRQLLATRISEAATLASQYKGLTSAYNDWLAAEDAGQERDMYENVIKGFETIDDEISRGWLDDGTIEFLELLTGRTDLAGKSGKELKKIYNDLDDTIANTSYSVRDFFTVDEDGNSTNTGVYNFLDAIGQLEEEKFGGKYVVKRDENGNIIAFDFKVAGGDKAIADALGISEELVQIMVRAADDAGFVISMDGTYRQLADLQNEARAAANYLKEIGKTDFEFDFNTSNVENLKTQLEEAHKILDDEKFWNKDGTFNFDANGATEAMTIVSTLQAKLDDLTSEQYGIGLTVEDEEFEEPLENLQTYGQKIAVLNQLELNPKANAEEIEKINGELDDIAEYFANLDDELKVKLGLEADDDIEEVKKKIESGEIKIPTVLDIQTNMDKNLETLADLALLNSGLLSEDEEEVIKKKYKIEATADEVDTSDIEEKTGIVEGTFGPMSGSVRELDIAIIAKTMGIEDVEDLRLSLANIDDKTIRAIAEAIGKGDVDELESAISGMDDKTVQAIANALGYDKVEDLKASIGGMKDNEANANAIVTGKTDVDNLNSSLDTLKSKDGTKVTFTTVLKTVKETIDNGVKKSSAAGKSAANKRTGANLKVSEVNGTANVNGTIGRAFKQGNWGTKNSGTALVGELGVETLVRDGRYFTIGNNGAEFIKYRKGDIIFNHVQTEELLSNGKVTSGGGRGRAFASGTAFSSGFGGIGKVVGNAIKNAVEKVGKAAKEEAEKVAKKASKSNKNSSNASKNKDTSTNTGSASNNDGGGTGKVDGTSVGKDKDKFEETIDFIEIAISRIEQEIDRLDKAANNVYKSWSERNTALVSEIGEVGEEITKQQSAYNRYMQEARSVGLDQTWVDRIESGTIDIYDESDFSEETAEKIKEYQQWYEKALACKDAIEELKETEASLYAQRVENASKQFEGALGVVEHEKNMLEEYINQSETQGWLVSYEYYRALSSNEKRNIAELEKQKAEMIAKFQEAMNAKDANGNPLIVEGSEEYYNMVNAIDEVSLSLEQANTRVMEISQNAQQLKWEQFDLLQEKISSITSETEFLIELLSSDKLFDDRGQLTDSGMATMGQHGVAYNTYMHQADLAREEAERLLREKERALYNGTDTYDEDLEKRYRELIASQQEYILAAQGEKEAIRDLVEEGINLELDALQELIDKKNEELESEKDLYEYQKKVKEQTEEIASLEKQMAAYAGDDSEEAKQKVQQLKVELETAREDLKETEWDKYISDTSAVLDELYTDYELILNTRLDNVDSLLSDIIDEVNSSAATIKTTLETEVNNVGATLSTTMSDIWSAEGNGNKVITKYGDNFQSQQTTTNLALGNIKSDVDAMAQKLGAKAKEKIEGSSTQSSSVKKPTSSNSSSNSNNSSNSNGNKEKVITDDTLMGIASAIWVYGKKSGWGNNPFRENKLTDKLGTSNAKKVQANINKYGSSGDLYNFWIKKGKNLDKYNYSAFKSGAKLIDESRLAWTQEGYKQEFIVRPSDGAILTPIAKGDSVLTSTASNNIWNMANSPAEFIKDNLNLGNTNVPNNASVNNSVVQHFENITFSMPNVHGYNDLLSEMQRDPKFEKLILSMTIDQIAGKSGLSKGKSIR